jgi:hypothetical protein
VAGLAAHQDAPHRAGIADPQARRAAAISARQGGTAAASSDTSLPSVAPKPPGSRKSRCLSMTTSAARAGSKLRGPGSASMTRVMAVPCGAGAPHSRQVAEHGVFRFVRGAPAMPAHAPRAACLRIGRRLPSFSRAARPPAPAGR